jgi:VWFA-related protein
MLVTVRNQAGEIVRGLTNGDVRVEEDGRPQTVGYFSPAANLPISVGLLIDAGESMRPLLDTERIASSQFFGEVLRRGWDVGAVLRFDGKAAVMQGFTNAKQQLEGSIAALEILPPVRGGPRLYDAIQGAAEGLLQRNGRKVLLVLSDGQDVGSKASIADAIEAAQRADAVIYAIGVTGKDSTALERLARETGGLFLRVSGANPLINIDRQIANELRNQYAIGFVSNVSGGGNYRKLHLTTLRREWTVRTREGYYAPGVPFLNWRKFAPGGPLGFLEAAFAFALYMTPTLIAFSLRKVNKNAAIGVVFVVNLLLGWTIIGWFFALGKALKGGGDSGYANQPMDAGPVSRGVWVPYEEPEQAARNPLENWGKEPPKCYCCHGEKTETCSLCGGHGLAQGCTMCVNSGKITCRCCQGSGNAPA